MKHKNKILIYRILSYFSVYIAGILINESIVIYGIPLTLFLIFHTLERIEEKKWNKNI